jgi:glycine/D-amino acid oxidase-like deaminating enzyme
LDVVVLEREACGFGASGRNGGWLVGELAGSPSPALDAAIRATVDEAIAAIAREGIDCDLVKGGTLSVAVDPVNEARLRDHSPSPLSGGPSHGNWIDAEQLAARVRVAGARGALFDPECARIHPAKLARGLAEAVERAGARIFEGTEVTAIEPHIARTAAGEVRARWVVQATEGYAPGDAVAPISSSMIVTEPLPVELWSMIGWDKRETLGDSAHTYMYAQRTADGRIAIGGRGVPYRYGSRADDHGRTHGKTVRDLMRALHRLLPQTKEVPIAHAWCGVLAVPRDWCAEVNFDPQTGLASAGGYVGHGVTSANLAGRTLSDLILRRQTDQASVGRPSIAKMGAGAAPLAGSEEPLQGLQIR